MFRPIVAIIRFSSESMVVVLYRIGMGSYYHPLLTFRRLTSTIVDVPHR